MDCETAKTKRQRKVDLLLNAFSSGSLQFHLPLMALLSDSCKYLKLLNRVSKQAAYFNATKTYSPLF